MTAELNTHYVLTDGTRFFYYLSGLGIYGGAFPCADGTPLARTNVNGWWASDHEAEKLEIHRPITSKATGYVLKNPNAQSEEYPATISVDDYEAAFDRDDPIVPNLYEAVTEEVPGEVELIEGTFVRLDGAPPADDGREWRASLPNALWNLPQYEHLFPGWLRGFHKHVFKLAEAHPRIKRISQFDGPNARVWANDGHSSMFMMSVPDQIGADNRAVAAAEWDALSGRVVAWFDEIAVDYCTSCNGHGKIVTGGTFDAFAQ
ncbi:hypothetical protein GCM10022221_67900 [Actinocorallia aurea]